MKRFAWLPARLCLMSVCCLSALALAPVASSRARADTGSSGWAVERIHIGENFLIDGLHSDCRVYGKPAIAFDGVNFLIAWQDGQTSSSSSSSVYASRITPDGEVLDPGGIPLSVSTSLHSGPASVSFDGENYMVVWDCTADSGADNSSWDLFCARVTPSGHVLAPGVQQITTGSDCWGNRPVGISFDGSEFLVVYRTKSSLIRGLRVSQFGTSLDGPTGFTISDNGKYPSVAFDGTNFFVVWHTPGLDYRGARVTTSGVVLDPDGITICAAPDNQEHGTVAFGGGCYLVVWEEWSTDRLRGKVRGARVSVAGTVLDTTPLNIGERCRGESAVMVTTDGTDFLVTWMAETQREDGGANPDFRLIDAWCRRVTPDGSFVDEVPSPIATSRWHASGPLAGYGAGRYLVAWWDHRLASPSIWGQMLDADATPAPAPSAPGPPDGSPPVWAPESSPTTGSLYAMVAFDGERAMTFGDLAGTTQGDLVRGLLGWSPGSSEPWTVYDAFAMSPDDVWTSGWAQGVHHLVGTAWSGVGGGSTGPSPIDTGIWGTDDEHLWFSGSGGTVRVGSGMDGLPYEFQNVGTTADLHDVWGFSWDDIYTVAEFGLVFHFDGQTWSRVPGIPTWETLNAVWGSGPNDIFAIGDFGTILHYDGAQWTRQYSGTAEDLQGLWGRNDSDVYAVGFGGTILHYDGAGWASESSGVAQDLLSVAGAPDQDGTVSVWIGGSAGRILHTRYSAANQAPVGVPDAYSTVHDQKLVVPPLGVLANDTDADGDPLHVELVSDVARGQLDLKPTGWFTYTPAAGWHGSDSFTYRVTDGFSSSAVTTVSISVAPPADTTAPTTTASGADAAWHKAAVTVSLTANDNADGSGMSGGLAKTEYKIDAAASWSIGTEVIVDAPANHSGDGVRAISYRSTDAAGNVEATKSVTVKIDTTSPAGSFTLAAGAATTTTTAVAGTSAVTEANGPLQMRFSLDGKASWSSWEAYAASKALTLPGSLGAKTVYAQYRDAAGNVLELSAAIELIAPPDTTAPTVESSGASEGSWYRVARLVTLTASDADSGVASITYTLDGIETTVLGAFALVSVPASPNRLHALSYYATDASTNSCVSKTLTFTTDTTGPVTAAQYASGRRGHAITLRYKIADALSPKATAIQIVVKNSHGTTITTIRPTTKNTATWYSVKWTPRARGTFRYYVYAKDLAGNAQRIKGNAKVVVR